MDIARTKNNTPLPPIKAASGLRLPPDRYCLSACNYKLRAAVQPKKVIKSGFDPAKNPLKSAALKKQTPLSTVPKTQNVNIPKPVFKFSTKTATAKPKIPETDQQQMVDIKMEIDDAEGSMKRKREDDDFEIVS
jgi:transcription initiation factor TFIID subunit 9B